MHRKPKADPEVAAFRMAEEREDVATVRRLLERAMPPKLREKVDPFTWGRMTETKFDQVDHH
jgi:hypothetical protein